MNAIACDIVLLPSSALAQKAIALSKHLESYDSRFTLKEDIYFPHISLYMAQLKQSDLEKVTAMLADIAATLPLDLVATRYYQAHGYIDVEYQRTTALDALQAAVIQAINPLRDGLPPNDKTRAQKATGPVLDNFTRYGYPAVGELFRPHLTFTRLVEDTAIPTDNLPHPNEFNGLFPKLGLFVLDNNNACVRKLAEIELKSTL